MNASPLAARKLALPRPGWMMKEKIAKVVMISIFVPCLSVAAPVDASHVFDRACAGCHVGGGNIVGGKTLKLRDLEMDNLLDVDNLSVVISKGKNRMPGFGVDCAPQGQCTFGPRLTDKEIRSLAEFVLAQAQNGWK